MRGFDIVRRVLFWFGFLTVESILIILACVFTLTIAFMLVGMIRSF